MRRATLKLRFALPLFLAVLVAFGFSADAAEGPPLRFRLAFASDEAERWDFRVSIDDGEVLDVRPLSIDPQHCGAVYAERGELRIDYHVEAQRGVIDFDVAGVGAKRIVVQPDSGEPVSFAIDEVRDQRQSQSIDGKTFLIDRGPSDRIRIDWPAETVVFAPGAEISFDAWIDAPPAAGDDPLDVTATLQEGRGGEEVWRSEPVRFEPIAKEASRVGISLRAPSNEGVYELSLLVREPPGFSRRFFPQGETPPLLERRFQVLVFDETRTPRAMPRSSEDWRLVSEPPLDTQRARGRIAAWTRWNTGDQRALPDPSTAVGAWRRLPPARRPGEATWRAIPLSVEDTNAPLRIELTTPAGAQQTLAVALLDRDERGELQPIGEALIEAPEMWPGGDDRTTEWIGWARTNAPLLIVANLDDTHHADFRGVRVYQPAAAKPQVFSEVRTPSERLLALDARSTTLLEDLAINKAVDEQTQIAFADLHTLWRTAQRLADRVESQGANGAVVSVNSPGAAWYESRVLGGAPRHDLSVWLDGAADLPRQPLLGLLHREFERRGLRIVPSLNLSGPLPRLERLGKERGESLLVTPGQAWRAGEPRYNPLAPAVATEAERIVDELVQWFGQSPAFGGVALELDQSSPLLLTGDRLTGFDTDTVERFLNDLGVDPPPGPTSREQYAELISTQADPYWQAWRRRQLAATHRRLDNACNLPVVRLIDPLIDASALRSLYAAPIESPPIDSAWTRSLGLGADASDAALERITIPTATAGANRLDTIAWAEAADRLAKQAGGDKQQGMVVAPKRRFRLVDAEALLGTELELSGVIQTPGATAEALVRAVVVGDPPLIIDSGSAAEGAIERRSVDTRELITALETSNALDGKMLVEDSVVVLRLEGGDGLTVVAANRGPWKQHASVSLTTQTRCAIGDVRTLSTPSQPEWCRPGGHVLTADLPPYGMRAWRVTDQSAELTGLRVRTAPEASVALTAAVQRLSSRDRSVRRSYDAAVNASFESIDEAEGVVGWTTASGNPFPGSTERAHQGQRAVYLASDSPDTSTMMSDWFATPATGQLVLVLQARAEDLADDATLRVEFELQGQETTTRELSGADLLSQWREVVLAVDDLPLDRPPMRIRFQLESTSGRVFLDTLQAEDLMLPLDYYAEETRGQRFAMVRLSHAAETALAEGRYDDCRQMLEGYWPQFVVQNFPPVAPTPEAIAQPETVLPDPQPADSEDEAEEAPTVAERVRQYLPRWWR